MSVKNVKQYYVLVQCEVECIRVCHTYIYSNTLYTVCTTDNFCLWTNTMQGVLDPPSQRGIIPRSFEHIFEAIQVTDLHIMLFYIDRMPNIQKFVVSKMFRAEILYIHCAKVFK